MGAQRALEELRARLKTQEEELKTARREKQDLSIDVYMKERDLQYLQDAKARAKKEADRYRENVEK